MIPKYQHIEKLFDNQTIPISDTFFLQMQMSDYQVFSVLGIRIEYMHVLYCAVKDKCSRYFKQKLKKFFIKF